MSEDKVRIQSKETSGFYKDHCDLCHPDNPDAQVYHYRPPGSKSGHCCKQHVPVRKLDGAIIVQGSLRSKPTPEAPQEWELKRMNYMPRIPAKIKTSVRSSLSADRFFSASERTAATTPIDPDKLVCHFCGVTFEKIHATSEKIPHVYRVPEMEIDPFSGEAVIVEKIRTNQEIRHACRKCCLSIKDPIVVVRV